MRETTAVRQRVRLRQVRPAGWWFDALLLAGFVALTVTLAQGGLLGLDLAVRDWVNAHGPGIAYPIVRALNFLGQGGQLLTPLAGVLAAAAALRARSIRPLLVVAATFAITFLTIGPLKLWTDRAAPGSTLAPEKSVRLFNTLPPGEYDLSYPSGHVANAVVWYATIALLLGALVAGRLNPMVAWAVRVGPPAILLFSTTYLNFHWLTDGVAALLLGLFLDRLLARVPWDDLPLPRWLGDWSRPAVFTRTP